MRKILIVFWLLMPIFLGAYHYGPGQEQMKRERAAASLTEADQAVAASDWGTAVEWYEAALKELPDADVEERWKIQLAKAKAHMQCSGLPQSRQELQTLVDAMVERKGTDPKLIEETRSTLAQSQYYMTWLMRLEGLSREVWGKEVEAARQNYRLLAEASANGGDTVMAKTHREDLESTIRLARLDLAELQGLPLPSQ